MPSLPLSVVTRYKVLFGSSAKTTSPIIKVTANIKRSTHKKEAVIAALLTVFFASSNSAYADSMSALIAQKSAQSNITQSAELAVPSAKIHTQSTIQRTRPNYASNVNPINTDLHAVEAQHLQHTPSYHTDNYQQKVTYRPNIRPDTEVSYRYPAIYRQAPSVLPAFLSGSYDNVDSEYLPLLGEAETQSGYAAREVIATARKMALNERTIIQGGCWDYLNEVFKRAGVTRDTVHKGEYSLGPYANSDDIEIGDWLYYINHGYNGVEHSGLFVGWVDKSAKQALIFSYAGESRREPARYRVYDLSNVYQIMRPTA